MKAEKKYIHIGCGMKAPKEWANFDASPTLLFEKIPLIGKIYTKNNARFPSNVVYGNIVNGLNLPLDSCKAIFASHVLEHLSLFDCRVALNNIYNLLEKDGIFRVVVPDLKILVKRYINSSNYNASEVFLKETQLGSISRKRGVISFFLDYLGNSKHLWMWDFESLSYELLRLGFVNIRKCDYGDSADPMFKYVEEADRFVNTVSIECQKP